MRAKPAPKHKKDGSAGPEIEAGEWTGTVDGTCHVSFGQTMQPGPPSRPVEFSYMILAASFRRADQRFTWPGVLMITAPNPAREPSDMAGYVFGGPFSPSLHLALEVTRLQFSDMLPMLEGRRLQNLHFTVGEKRDDIWPVYSWGLSNG